MKKKIIFSIILITIISLLVIAYCQSIDNFDKSIEKKYVFIADSNEYGDAKMSIEIKQLEKYGLIPYNFIDSNFFKNKTFYWALNGLTKNYPLFDTFSLYRTGRVIRSYRVILYVDSNYLYYLDVFLPKDTIKKYKEIDFNLLFRSWRYKVYQRRMDINKKREISLSLNRTDIFAGPDQDPFYRKLDSLKAVLKR